MPTPVRFTSGLTQDAPWQPLALSGFPNPFFYHVSASDFDTYGASEWTPTATGNGGAALAAGDGGILALSTNNSTPLATDIASIQRPVAAFTFVPATSSVAGKKSFFLTRLQVSDATNAAFVCGLMNTTTTPFAATDGLYFSKASGAANNLVLISMVGSTPTTLTIPTAAYTLSNNTNIDLAWSFDGKGNVYAYVNGNMVGYIPQSGTGSTTPNRGGVASFSPTLTTATLNPTLAIQSGTTSSKSMSVDFVLAARER